MTENLYEIGQQFLKESFRSKPSKEKKKIMKFATCILLSGILHSDRNWLPGQLSTLVFDAKIKLSSVTHIWSSNQSLEHSI